MNNHRASKTPGLNNIKGWVERGGWFTGLAEPDLTAHHQHDLENELPLPEHGPDTSQKPKNNTPE